MRSMMKNLFGFLMATFTLLSCTTTEYVGEQCVVDVVNDTCVCRQYKFSTQYVGPQPGEAIVFPLNHCHKMVGFSDYIGAATYWENVRREINEQINNGCE